MRTGAEAVTIDSMNQTSDVTGDAPPTVSPPPRRLTRSSRDRRVAGVAGGLGAYTNLDPVVVRLAFVLLTFFGGSGLLIYLIAWLVLPEDDDTGGAPSAALRWPDRPEGMSTPALVVGGLLILIGLASTVGAGPGLTWPFRWPVILIGIGLAVLIGSQRSRRRPDDDPPLGAAPAPPAGRGPDAARTGSSLPVPYLREDAVDAELVDDADHDTPPGSSPQAVAQLEYRA